MALAGKRILLIIAGGIAAYKSLDLIRRLQGQGADVRCLLTPAGEKFVTPLSVAALSGQALAQDLFSLTDDAGMAHITLSRCADLILVAPATADLIGKMALGLADDLASTTLMAAEIPIVIAPAMNHVMWRHPAVQNNLSSLHQRGVVSVGPAAGDLACGEVGDGRMAEVSEIVSLVIARLGGGKLSGKRALVTSGPTVEPIDPVRVLSNRSSGKQGHAIAAALARAGASVTLVSGPVAIPDPSGVAVQRVETAHQMLAACEAALPADLVICAAAVADWRPRAVAPEKLKKHRDAPPPTLELEPNPDILAILAQRTPRPSLMVGFAAETQDLLAHGAAKLAAKGCDMIIANDVSAANGVFGGDHNKVWLIEPGGVTDWPSLSKDAIADRLVALWTERLT